MSWAPYWARELMLGSGTARVTGGTGFSIPLVPTFPYGRYLPPPTAGTMRLPPVPAAIAPVPRFRWRRYRLLGSGGTDIAVSVVPRFT